jgi:hypothetical protein
MYYTYAYLREDRTPYYIGKGQGNRAYKRCKKDIKPPKDKSRIILLKQNLTEEEAFRHEVYMIAVFGRKDLGTGILHNRTDGGDGLSNPSVETRRKMSELSKERTHSEETKEKIKKIVLGKKWWNNGKENSHSKECPGNGWVLGRIITWDEEKRIKTGKTSIKMRNSKNLYKFTYKNGEIVYASDINELGKICGSENAFYRVSVGQRKSYKGWISVEKCYDVNVDLNPQIIIDLCKIERKYKITHKDGTIMYSTDLRKIGKEYGYVEGFRRVMTKERKSYKGWISVEMI